MEGADTLCDLLETALETGAGSHRKWSLVRNIMSETEELKNILDKPVETALDHSSSQEISEEQNEGINLL